METENDMEVWNKAFESPRVTIWIKIASQVVYKALGQQNPVI